MSIILFNKYTSINNIQLYDNILDHNNFFRKITNIDIYLYDGDIYEIYFHNHFYILECNSEQLLLTKHKHTDIIEWKKVKDINKNHYIGMIINNNNINSNIYIYNIEQWFLLGYYISSSKYEQFKIKFYINNNIFIYIKKKNYGNYNKKIWKYILDFIDNNYIPEWIQDAPVNLLKIFIDGYQYNKTKLLSKNIALGLQRIYAKIGICTYIFKEIKINNCYKQIEFYILNITKFTILYKNNIIDENYFWFVIHTIKTKLSNNDLFYDFNQSYIINNIITKQNIEQDI